VTQRPEGPLGRQPASLDVAGPAPASAGRPIDRRVRRSGATAGRPRRPRESVPLIASAHGIDPAPPAPA